MIVTVVRPSTSGMLKRAIGAVVARFLDTEEVTGSNPVSPTTKKHPLTCEHRSGGLLCSRLHVPRVRRRCDQACHRPMTCAPGQAGHGPFRRARRPRAVLPQAFRAALECAALDSPNTGCSLMVPRLRRGRAWRGLCAGGEGHRQAGAGSRPDTARQPRATLDVARVVRSATPPLWPTPQ